MKNPFGTERDAKDFLVSRILAEAKSEGVPLSELERKMMYFTETDENLPEMLEVNAAFEREYDTDAYEENIAGIVRSIYTRDDRSEEEIEKWRDAVTKLSEGDHYLLLLIDGASQSPSKPRPSLGKLGKWLPTIDGRGKREPGDRKRLILVALGFGAVLLIALVVSSLFR